MVLCSTSLKPHTLRPQCTLTFISMTVIRSAKRNHQRERNSMMECIAPGLKNQPFAQANINHHALFWIFTLAITLR